MKLSSESATPLALAATAPPTRVWVQLQWDQTDPCSLRWAASAPMAALGWAAQLQDSELCSTSLMIYKNKDVKSANGLSLLELFK